jgi:hypothetical protein
MPGEVEEIAARMELLTGLRLGAGDVAEGLTVTEWAKRRKKLAGPPGL